MKFVLLILIYTCTLFAYNSIDIRSPNIILHKAGYFSTDQDITPQQAYTISKKLPLQTLLEKGYFLGKSFETFWFVFDISTTTDEKLFLDSKEVFTGNKQDLFVFDSTGKLIQSYQNGQVVPIEKRAVQTYPVRFSLENNSNHYTYLLKLSSPFPIQASFALGTMPEVEKSWGKTLIIYTVTTFILLSFLFYNALLYIISREKLFLFYILYIGGFFAVVTSRWSYLIDFVGFTPRTLFSLYFISLAIAILGVIFFTIELLKFNKTDKNIKTVLYMSYFVIVLNLFHFFLKLHFLNALWIIIGLLSVILLLIEVMKKYLAGDKVALYYLISTGIGTSLMVGSIYLTLYLKIWSSNEWSINMPMVALIWDALTLSLFLAYRMKLIENEKNEAKKLIEQKARFTIIGETLGNIAHQWRQPLGELGAINTSIEFSLLLHQNIDKEKLKSSIALSNSIIEKLSKTIDTFQGFFHQSTENHFEITQCIDDALVFIQGSFEPLKINIQRNYNTPYVVQGNNDEFFEVLLILFNNAKDAIIDNKTKNPYIKISLQSQKEYVVINVQDNGGGIKVKELSTIFDPYQSTKQLTGMGIGLFTAKSIIEERMKGHIKAQNTSNGAEFSIELPISK